MGFDWNGHDGDMYRSLSGVVKNGGYFKTVKQAEFFRPRNPERPRKGEESDLWGYGSVGQYHHTARTDAKFLKSCFGIPLIKKDQYVIILGATLRFGGGGGHGHRVTGWAFVIDCQGVVKKYKLKYMENERDPNNPGVFTGIGVDGSRTELEFSRSRDLNKELDVTMYDPTFKELKKQVAQKKKVIEEKNAKSRFIGNVNKREIFKLKLIHSVGSEGHYGMSYIYFFEDAMGNKVVWFSSRDVGLEKGRVYVVKGTVKSHDMYNGINQTYLTRCKIE